MLAAFKPNRRERALAGAAEIQLRLAALFQPRATLDEIFALAVGALQRQNGRPHAEIAFTFGIVPMGLACNNWQCR